jgi:hypothetical protein
LRLLDSSRIALHTRDDSIAVCDFLWGVTNHTNTYLKLIGPNRVVLICSYASSIFFINPTPFFIFKGPLLRRPNSHLLGVIHSCREIFDFSHTQPATHKPTTTHYPRPSLVVFVGKSACQHTSRPPDLVKASSKNTTYLTKRHE